MRKYIIKSLFNRFYSLFYFIMCFIIILSYFISSIRVIYLCLCVYVMPSFLFKYLYFCQYYYCILCFIYCFFYIYIFFFVCLFYIFLNILKFIHKNSLWNRNQFDWNPFSCRPFCFLSVFDIYLCFSLKFMSKLNFFQYLAYFSNI